MVARRGHSLVEVVVALTVLGAGLAAVSATTLISTRRTREAVVRQERHAVLASLLDSLVADADPRSGRRSTPWGAAEWEVVGPDGGPRTVRIRLPDGAELRTVWIAPPPSLPEVRP